MKYLFIVSLMVPSLAYADFTCDGDGSVQINANGSGLFCGVGVAANEGGARELALQNAISEFDIICAQAEGCLAHHRFVRPRRAVCQQKGNLWECRRLISVEVTSAVPQSASASGYMAAQDVSSAPRQENADSSVMAFNGPPQGGCGRYYAIYPLALLLRVFGSYPDADACFPF